MKSVNLFAALLSISSILMIASVGSAQEAKLYKCDNGTLVTLGTVEGVQVLMSFANENAGDPDVLGQILENGEIAGLVDKSKKYGTAVIESSSKIQVTLTGSPKTTCTLQ